MIYLDYNATTPIDPEVRKAMLPYLREKFGNPSSSHLFGIDAKRALEKARSQVAALINCQPEEIIFTSGGTESNNLALRGYAAKFNPPKSHIITSQIEHPAILEVCKYLEKKGFFVTYLPVNQFGEINLSDLKREIRAETSLISIMHSNNEIGTLQPIKEASAIAHKNGICFHSDAAQSISKVPVNVADLGVDLLSIAGHKLYAPKGIGALFIKQGTKLDKIIFGAEQEKGLSPGTENIVGIVGLGKACEIAKRDLKLSSKKMRSTRDKLFKNLHKIAPDLHLNGHPIKRLPNTLNVSFPDKDEFFQYSLFSEIACSAGAACHSDEVSVSHVLQAIDLHEKYQEGTIRFSTGKFTTEEEIKEAKKIINNILQNF